MGRGVQTVSSQFAVQGLLKYFSRLVTSRRRQPGDDVVTYLTSSEQGDERLSDEELVHFCYLLFLAGHETTRNSISGGMLALLEHPAEWERLRRDPGLLPTAVEEMLRWTSPIMHMARVASRDVDIRGQRIRAGEKVVLWYPSANRDEAVFAAPDRFDIGRHPNPHLAFGLGQHFCLGAGLARVQMRTLFAALIERRVTIELDGDVQRLHSVFIGGITRLPVRFGGAVRKCPFAHERIA
jgi:cytochrome P450